jgi:hypothetical protein
VILDSNLTFLIIASSKIIVGVFDKLSIIFDLMSEFIIRSRVLERASFNVSISSSLNSRIAILVLEEINSDDSFFENRLSMI